MGNFFRKLSVRLSSAFGRFSLSVLLFALFTASACIFNHDKFGLDSEEIFIILYYLGTAALLNLLPILIREHLSIHTWAGRIIVSAINLIWLLICVLIWIYLPEEERLSWAIALAVIPFALGMSVLFLPVSIGQRDDKRFWNWTLNTLTGTAASAILGATLSGAVCLLAFGFDILFGVEVPDEVYGDIRIVGMCLVTPVTFMGLLQEKVNDGTERPGIKGLTLIHYLLLPLVAGYIFVLYAYTAKILFAWELPDGAVSWLVSASMACMLLVEYLLYPVSLRDGTSQLDRIVSRWLPALFIPLLLLMSIGIAKRIGDYGITIARLYLILFNLWCYAVCIGLLLYKSSKIWWIPASFVVLLVLSSVGPQNFSAITMKTMSTNVKATLEEIVASHKVMVGDSAVTRVSYPLNEEVYKAIMEAADSKATVIGIESKMEYIANNFPQARKELIAFPSYELGLYAASVRSQENDEKYFSFTAKVPDSAVTIPEGYTRFQIIDITTEKPITDTIDIKISEDCVPISLPVSMICELDRASGEKEPITINADGGVFMISYISLSFWESNNYNIEIKGIIFLP